MNLTNISGVRSTKGGFTLLACLSLLSLESEMMSRSFNRLLTLLYKCDILSLCSGSFSASSSLVSIASVRLPYLYCLCEQEPNHWIKRVTFVIMTSWNVSVYIWVDRQDLKRVGVPVRTIEIWQVCQVKISWDERTREQTLLWGY